MNIARGIYRLGNIKRRGAQIVVTDPRCEKIRDIRSSL